MGSSQRSMEHCSVQSQVTGDDVLVPPSLRYFTTLS
jgi:hypothetical protein